MRGSRIVFEPTWESLAQYRCPDWFPKARFGIWSHWGPQCVPRQGDWYARNMYVQGTRQYTYHVEHYGHPSRVGYKDVVRLWKAEHWEPGALMRRYRMAGARYFVSLGCHCDNFDCWDSRHHAWNSVRVGPRRDIVGEWRMAALDQGLRFGVSEHLAWSWSWFNVNKGADAEGPLAGVPYDGNDPAYQDLYFPPHAENTANFSLEKPEVWTRMWYSRVRDLIERYRPDIVYGDGGAFGDVGLRQLADYYNSSQEWHGGELEGVYTLKNHEDQERYGQYREGAAVLDVERGSVSGIRAEPWQSDTCIGQWYYFDGFPYKSSRQVIHLLLDIVSRNGTMLLNFPLLPDGTLDAHCDGVLEDITRWFAANGEGIHDTRPWKTFGEGPTSGTTGSKKELGDGAYTPADVRFTTRGETLYLFFMLPPEGDFVVRSLGTAGPWARPIAEVRLLGSDEKLPWRREADRLVIARPRSLAFAYGIGFRVRG